MRGPKPAHRHGVEEGLRRLSPSIIAACKQDDHKARADLSFAAMLGGMAITNAKLGAAHGLASALGGKLNAPHSVISGRLAPFVMSENINEAKAAGRSDILNRYKRIAQIVTGRTNAHIEDSVLWVQMVLDKLALPHLSEFGVCSTSFEQVAQDALQSVAIKGNPLPLNEERLIHILNQVCGSVCVCETQDSVTQANVKVIDSILQAEK